MALPRTAFAGKDVLEFGPDSGENALAFASWGARLTLVEPNERAHAAIRTYFEQFGMLSALAGITNAHVLDYRDDARYDVVVAEGFIYTVQPTRTWLAAFRRLLRDDGIFLVTYYERLGALVELTLRALHAVHRRARGSSRWPPRSVCMQRSGPRFRTRGVSNRGLWTCSKTRS